MVMKFNRLENKVIKELILMIGNFEIFSTSLRMNIYMMK